MSEKEIWTEEKVLEVQRIMKLLEVTSLDCMIKDEREHDVIPSDHMVVDDSPGPQELLERKECKETLIKYVNKLPPRQCIVIKMRYGLEDGHYKTLEEVGKYFNVSRERIRQIEEKAIRKLKHLLTVNGKFRNINDF